MSESDYTRDFIIQTHLETIEGMRRAINQLNIEIISNNNYIRVIVNENDRLKESLRKVSNEVLNLLELNEKLKEANK